MQLKADILDAEDFKAYADSTLVVFVADLPRSKAALTEAQLAENRALAAKYNPAGQFPQLILFKDGKPVKSISGTFTSFLALKAWIESE
jgi:thiol-disulfide isomerase/thioredoxin